MRLNPIYQNIFDNALIVWHITFLKIDSKNGLQQFIVETTWNKSKVIHKETFRELTAHYNDFVTWQFSQMRLSERNNTGAI